MNLQEGSYFKVDVISCLPNTNRCMSIRVIQQSPVCKSMGLRKIQLLFCEFGCNNLLSAVCIVCVDTYLQVWNMVLRSQRYFMLGYTSQTWLDEYFFYSYYLWLSVPVGNREVGRCTPQLSKISLNLYH